MHAIVRRQAEHIPDSLAGLPSLLQRVYTQRGVQQNAELDYQLQNLIPPGQLKGMDAAVARLLQAHSAGQAIVIVGDFDADGATSCAVGMKGLRSLGFDRVNFLTPNRFEYGYGLTPEIIELARQQFDDSIDLIITVDNGIAAIEGVRHAVELGIDVLVTDHHLPGQELPAAVAIVNPNQPGCDFASKALAGVGVMFYLLMALRRALHERGIVQAEHLPKLADLLDLVALGTVADVVPLDYNNRILVEQGLRRIRAGVASEGLKALLQVSGRDARTVTAQDLAFAAGPRLNAAGRMDDMNIGIRCLLADDEYVAASMAQQLDHFNRERRSVEADMLAAAMRMLSEMGNEDLSGRFALSLYDTRWHQGVIGILASRLKDRYHRPTVIFANSDTDNEVLKGSARSIKGLHIRDVLSEVNLLAPDLILQFGGHAMAAGLTILRSNFEIFQELFEQVCAVHLRDVALDGELLSDGEISGQEFTLENAKLLRYAGPWGQGLPEPLFDGKFVLRQQRIVGEKHLKMIVTPWQAQGIELDAIAFNVDTDFWPNTDVAEVTLAYRLDVNHFRGRENLQLIVEHCEPVAAAITTASA